MEVNGRKDVQNGGRSILKMITGSGLFSSLSKVKIYFFLLFTPNLSYFNSFKPPYKIRLLDFCSPLNSVTLLIILNLEPNYLLPSYPFGLSFISHVVLYCIGKCHAS